MVRFTDVEEGEGQRPGQRPGLPALDRVMQEAGTHLDRAAAVAATAAKRLWFRTWGKRKQDL
jgi:hypothetical protein